MSDSHHALRARSVSLTAKQKSHNTPPSTGLSKEERPRRLTFSTRTPIPSGAPSIKLSLDRKIHSSAVPVCALRSPVPQVRLRAHAQHRRRGKASLKPEHGPILSAVSWIGRLIYPKLPTDEPVEPLSPPLPQHFPDLLSQQFLQQPRTVIEVYAFGANDRGQLGLGGDPEVRSVYTRPVRVPLSLDEPVLQIAAAGCSSYFLTPLGVYLAGSPVTATTRTDWCYTPEPRLIYTQEHSPVIQMAAGATFIALLLADGSVCLAGRMEMHPASRWTASRLGFRTIFHGASLVAAGGHHLLMLDHEHRVHVMGENNRGQAGRTLECELVAQPSEMQTVSVLGQAHSIHPVKIAAGHTHSMFLFSDGSLAVCGTALNAGTKSDTPDLRFCSAFQPGPKKPNLTIVDIFCGQDSSFALAQSGNLYAWGCGLEGSLATGRSHLAERPCYTLYPISHPAVSGEQVLTVAGGKHFTAIVTATGSVLTVGEGAPGHGAESARWVRAVEQTRVVEQAESALAPGTDMSVLAPDHPWRDPATFPANPHHIPTASSQFLLARLSVGIPDSFVAHSVACGAGHTLVLGMRILPALCPFNDSEAIYVLEPELARAAHCNAVASVASLGFPVSVVHPRNVEQPKKPSPAPIPGDAFM